MKKVLGGVALAAVMACGWASGASAAVLSGSFDGVLAADPSTNVHADFSFDAPQPHYEATLLNGTFSFSAGNFSVSNVDATFSYYFNQVNSGPFDGGSSIGLVGYQHDVPDPVYFSLNFITKNRLDPSKATQDISNSETYLLSSLYTVLSNGTEYKINVSQIDLQNFNSLTIPGPVPLPASAPLFGLALIGLAVAGYGAKRKRAA